MEKMAAFGPMKLRPGGIRTATPRAKTLAYHAVRHAQTLRELFIASPDVNHVELARHYLWAAREEHWGIQNPEQQRSGKNNRYLSDFLAGVDNPENYNGGGRGFFEGRAASRLVSLYDTAFKQ